MSGLSIVINYINSHREIVCIDDIKNIVDLNGCSSKEVVEIFRAVLRHNSDVLHEHNQEVQNAKKKISLIEFKGYNPETTTPTLASKAPTTMNVMQKYISFLAKPFNEIEFIQILNEISTFSYAEQILSELLLYLYNEKTSVINMLHDDSIDEDDRRYITEQITDIENKISAIEAYNIEIEEEQVEVPKVSKIALLRLPSGNIGLLKDIEAIKNSFYGETFYYQDLLKLLEAIRSGDFISVKKLHGIDTYEDRIWQLRLSFSYYNGMIIITSLFVKKSNSDAGVYSTLKSRLKYFEHIKNEIVATDEDIQILDSTIEELKELINKRGGNNR